MCARVRVCLCAFGLFLFVTGMMGLIFIIWERFEDQPSYQ